MSDMQEPNNYLEEKRTKYSSSTDKTHTSSVRQLLKEKRELAEKRRFGLAPLAVDVITHSEISPNVPDNLARAPWFYEIEGPTLSHQRHNKESSFETINECHSEIREYAPSSKYIPGACKNCGSFTHKLSECIYPRKKIGAVFTNKVKGRSVEVKPLTVKNYAQKRDRYYGDIGIDLMKQAEKTNNIEENDINNNKYEAVARQQNTLHEKQWQSQDKKVRFNAETTSHEETKNLIHDQLSSSIFENKSAQHGGLQIKELPKYLENISNPEETFFDPKTGAMRGNPNSENTMRTFQGDLQRYQSGDFYHYIESQYRFLSGESKSFVDFAYDNEMRLAKEKEQMEELDKVDKTEENNNENAIISVLYESNHYENQTKPNSTESSTNIDDQKSSEEDKVTDLSEVMEYNLQSNRVNTVADEMESLINMATKHQHSHVYGSHFNTNTFE